MVKFKLLKGPVILLILAIANALPFTMLVLAQNNVGSSEPISLSQVGDNPSWPQIVSDLTGRVHVVWSELPSDQDNESTGAIYHISQETGMWSSPTDIIALPSSSILIDDLQVDSRNYLILVWRSYPNLYISVAPGSDSERANSWKTERFPSTGRIGKANIGIDQDDGLHLIFTEDDRTINYAYSSDLGISWQKDRKITLTNDQALAYDHPSIAISNNNTIFATWTENSGTYNWGPSGIFFAKSETNGDSWEAPFEIESRDGYGNSDIIIDDSGYIHIQWIGNLDVGGRYHVWSNDGGYTWSDIVEIASPDEITGYAGKGSLLVDSDGSLFVVVAGALENRGQIWFSRWSGTEWSVPQSVSSNLTRSESVDATISNGNRMHAAWIDYATNQIWYSNYDTGASYIEPKNADLFVDDLVLEVDDTLEERQLNSASAFNENDVPGMTPQFRDDINTDIPPTNDYALRGIIFSTLVVLLIIGLIFAHRIKGMRN